MQHNYPSRRNQRLKGYDYNQNGKYFITICTKDREILFGDVDQPNVAHQMIEKVFNDIIHQYNQIVCDKYVIMPNHFHAIIEIKSNSEISILDFVKMFKSITTNKYIDLVKSGSLPPFNGSIWQRSFYDRIIRSEVDYLKYVEYIENNPMKWKLDKYYSGE